MKSFKTPLDNPKKLDKRRLYGRRLGRPLNQSRQKIMDELLSKLSVSEDALSEGNLMNPHDLFETKPKRLVCEIGFGDGDHLAGMMKQDPHSHYIGAEPYINGMSAFLKQISNERLDQSKVKVWMDDAIRLLQHFTDESLDEIYILNPDPWPKARHHKRRIINPDNLDLFARLLKPESKLIMATDVDDLAEWMVTEASNHSQFTWTANSKEDWQKMPKNWIETKYEAKGKAAGRKQTYLIFKRI